MTHQFRHQRAVLRATIVTITMLAGIVSQWGCSSVAGNSSSSIVVITLLVAAPGATPTQFGGTLASDVVTLVKKSEISGQLDLVPTVFEDVGQVTMQLALKDPGPSASPATPSALNSVTLTTYHVNFIRADGGGGTPGVDVPFPFDGAMTVNVTASPTPATFTIVRAQAKESAPLLALVGGGGAGEIATIAQITFTGTDQTGHTVSVTGQIGVNFSDWGDPG